MFNKVFIDGHLVRDIEVRQTAGGTIVGRFTIGNNRKLGNGEKEAMFFDVICFGNTAEWNSELKKGDKAVIEGRLQQDRWTDDRGKTRSRIVIVADRILRKPKQEQPAVKEDEFNFEEWEG